jgi:hypothetical protein
MTRDEGTALGALVIATLALMLASHPMPVIPVDLSLRSWQAAFASATCVECVFSDYLLAP